MILLVEQYAYDVSKLEKGLQRIRLPSRGKLTLDEVGYYLSAELKDCVFILPKVVLWTHDANGVPLPNGQELVLGKYTPEEFVHPEKLNLSVEERSFIYGFSTWIYRALAVYNRMNRDNGIIVEQETVHVAKTGHRRRSETLLDVLLSLQEFARENRDFFFFTVRNRHSGLNKINWTRTMAKSSAAWEGDSPVYLCPVNKRRQINFDEELLVIFFSILNYMNRQFGFEVPIDFGYELISENRFRAYVENGLGKRRLLAIKYKYFSDRALRLWNLCYAFFESEHKIHLTGDYEEYLLAKSFDRVFEAMIDELVGDRKSSMPKELTTQDDGKLVDHLYLDRDLAGDDEMRKLFYIADSKYYKDGTDIGKESRAKQFTYARNIIQWHLDLFLKDGDAADYAGSHNLRDDVTEGYDIVPNFFISAMMDGKLRDGYRDEAIKMSTKTQSVHVSRQYENRLFDRDTLLVAHYDVNFLFVLSLYAQDNAYRKAAWKDKVRKQFRDEMRKVLSDRFDFYAMTPKAIGNERDFLKSDFQTALGRTYRPFADVGGRPYYAYAEEKADPLNDNDDVRHWLETCFEMERCPLGADPVAKLQAKVSLLGGVHATAKYSETIVQETVLFGTCHGADQLNRIIKGQGFYHMAVEQAAVLGIHGHEDAGKKRILYVMPSSRKGETEVHRFRITHCNGKVADSQIHELGWMETHSSEYWLWAVEPIE